MKQKSLNQLCWLTTHEETLSPPPPNMTPFVKKLTNFEIRQDIKIYQGIIENCLFWNF